MERRLFLAATLASLGARSAGGADLVPVVASFSVLADMTRQIGGPYVNVDSLVGPDGDVHVYEPTPRDLRRVKAARMLVRNGLQLEGWMDRLTEAAGFAGTVVVAANKVMPRTMHEAGGAITVDPHAWQDPRNAVLYVQAIGSGLA
ncbi:MAG TPA: zinc ABC transporter substrate-binding protein, partial [Rhodopila sp.]|nr:zinc ABC transporter substrate-binding protein [Rhodopila sp.]